MDVFVVTYCYDDDNGIMAYANVFATFDEALTDAQIAQSEFTDSWDEGSFDAEHYEEANDFGIFTCTDDDYNTLVIRIEMKSIRTED